MLRCRECPLCADFVAKVGGPLQVRNFRIQWARRLNQCCAAGLFFESMLRVRMRKFFLQQYLPTTDIGLRDRRNSGRPIPLWLKYPLGFYAYATVCRGL
jgi:hypothetical protein